MELFQFSLVAFTSIFVLVDPIAAIPTFLAMTGENRARGKNLQTKCSSAVHDKLSDLGARI